MNNLKPAPDAEQEKIAGSVSHLFWRLSEENAGLKTLIGPESWERLRVHLEDTIPNAEAEWSMLSTRLEKTTDAMEVFRKGVEFATTQFQPNMMQSFVMFMAMSEMRDRLAKLLAEAKESLDYDPVACCCHRVNGQGETVVPPYSGECLFCRIKTALAADFYDAVHQQINNLETECGREWSALHAQTDAGKQEALNIYRSVHGLDKPKEKEGTDAKAGDET